MVNTFPTLILIVLNSCSFLQKGEIIQINAQGIVNHDHRNEKDGITYFGYIDNTENEILIDYNFPLKNNEIVNTKYVGKHFQIEFIIERNAYFVRDLGVGYGTFIRINSPLVLKNNMLINLGETFFVVNIIEKNPQEDTLNENEFHSFSTNSMNVKLKIKIFREDMIGETFFFPPLKKINIGRSSNAEICIEDKLLSKIHCNINFDNQTGWTLKDGSDNGLSTNGTWLYLNEEAEIYDKMIFKANQSIFQCKLGTYNSKAKSDPT